MMKKIIFSQSLLILLTLIVFSGCKKKHTEDFIGPKYNAVPPNFTVENNTFYAYNKHKKTNFSTNLPVASVNINTNAQYYKTTFSDEVRWKLRIYSWKTKAEKIFTGFSNFIDSTNTKWYGESDNDYFFGYVSANDSAEITLSFIGTDFMIRDTMRLQNRKDYHYAVINGVRHYVIDDFDGGNALTVLSSFYPDADDLGGGNTGNNAYNVIKNQGNFSYRMSGRDNNNNTYLGSCNTPTLNDIPLDTFKVTDPNDMFVNLYVYGTGKPNTTVSVIAFENDKGYTIGQEFKQNENDKYIYQIGVTWTGWRLVSFRYSAFRRPNTGGGLGNNLLNPERLSGMALELDSYPTPGFPVEAMVDMLVITEHGTFQK